MVLIQTGKKLDRSNSKGGDLTNMAEVNSGTETDPGLKELHAECEHTWAKVKDLQSRLEETRQPPRLAVSDRLPPLVSILREKERQLRAEIEIARDFEPRTPPKNIQVVECALVGDLEGEVCQLRETLSLVESQRQQLQASIQQENQFQEQLTAINTKLQEKVDSVEGEAPEDAVETVGQELEAKIDQARNTEGTVMKKMAAFVSKHFPMPEPAQVAKDLRSSRKKSSKGTMPLKDILLELMTKCVESPNDPYMQLTDRHWPAYVELLLRCNIILHHPDDNTRVKLVPFHL